MHFPRFEFNISNPLPIKSFIIAIICILGFLFGVYLVRDSAVLVDSYTILSSANSRLLWIAIKVLPLLSACLCMLFSLPGIAFFILAGEYLLFGACTQLIIQVFSAGGWLVHFFLLFSQGSVCFLLSLYLFSHSQISIIHTRRSIIICILLLIISCLIEQNIFAPFIISLL